MAITLPTARAHPFAFSRALWPPAPLAVAAGTIGLASAFGLAVTHRPALILALLFAPFALVAAWVYPEWCLYLTTAGSLVPWKAPMPLSGLAIEPAALAAPLLLAVVLCRRLLRREPLRIGRFGLIGMVLLLLAAASLPRTFEPKWSAVDVFLLTVAPLCLYFAFINEPRARMAAAVKIFVLSTTAVCLLALLGLTLFPDLQGINLQADGANGAIRAASIYGNPNGLAMLINLAWPFAVIFAALERRARLGWATAAGVLLITLLLTFSLGGWAAAAAVAGVSVMARSRRYRLVILGAAGLLAALIVAVPDLSGRVALGLSPDNWSFITRQELWQTALQMAAEGPIFGIGFGPFNYANYLNPAYVTDVHVASTHNVYLDFLLFTGAVGLLCYLTLLLLATVRSVRLFRHGAERQPRLYALAILAVLAGWTLHGLVDVTYFSFGRVMPFWMLLAFLDSQALPTPDRMTMKPAIGDASHEPG